MNNGINFTSQNNAVTTGDKKISFTETGLRISAFEKYFKKKNVQKGELTGILINNSIDYIAAVFALWKIEAVPVLLNTRLTSREVNDLLSENKINRIITNNKYADKAPLNIQLNLDKESFDETFNESNKDENSPGTIHISDIVMFTSGSSGNPKGVLLRGEALISSISTSNTVLNYSSDDRWLASLPFYHIGGLMIVLRAFAFGVPVILPDTLRLEEIKYSFENYKPTLTSLVPTQLQRFIEEGLKPNPELRNLLLGGGQIDQSLVNLAIEKGWPVSAVYGSTETSSFIAYLTPEELKKNPGSSGKAVYPNQIEIIDSGVIEGDPSGEIVIKSDSLFKEYLNDPTESSRKLVNGKYYTGDYGFLDQDNYLYVLSRRTDLIISGGENIDPAEVEKHILRFPGVRDVCVFGRKNDEWGEVVNAAIDADESVTDEELDEFLKKDLARYKIPKAYFRVDEIPRTALGKLRREKIKMMFNQQ